MMLFLVGKRGKQITYEVLFRFSVGFSGKSLSEIPLSLLRATAAFAILGQSYHIQPRSSNTHEHFTEYPPFF